MGNLIISPWQLQNDEGKLDGAAVRIHNFILQYWHLAGSFRQGNPEAVNKRLALIFSK